MKPQDLINWLIDHHSASYEISQLKVSEFTEFGLIGHCFAASCLWLENFHASSFNSLYEGKMLCDPINNPEHRERIDTAQKNASFYPWNHQFYLRDLNEQLSCFDLKATYLSSTENEDLNQAIGSLSGNLSGLVFMQEKKGLSSKQNPGHTIAFGFRHCPGSNHSIFSLFGTDLGQISLIIDTNQNKKGFMWLNNMEHDTHMSVYQDIRVDLNLQINRLINKISSLLKNEYEVYKGVAVSYQPKLSTCLFNAYERLGPCEDMAAPDSPPKKTHSL